MLTGTAGVAEIVEGATVAGALAGLLTTVCGITPDQGDCSKNVLKKKRKIIGVTVRHSNHQKEHHKVNIYKMQSNILKQEKNEKNAFWKYSLINVNLDKLNAIFQ